MGILPRICYLLEVGYMFIIISQYFRKSIFYIFQCMIVVTCQVTNSPIKFSYGRDKSFTI